MSEALVAVFKKADKIGGDRHEALEDAFTVAAGTPHVVGLWDCPLVCSTSIAPSQRSTTQASKSRVSEYCTASVHKERRALLPFYAMVAPYLAPLVQRV